jgi:hypothetical protein
MTKLGFLLDVEMEGESTIDNRIKFALTAPRDIGGMQLAWYKLLLFIS